jgi:FKBP-type peptidyl-prolyl cis-trans isomerase
MNTRWMLALTAGMLALPALAADKLEFKNDTEKASYIIGVQTGRNFKKDKIDIDYDLLLKGMKDGQAGTSQIGDDETRKFLNAFMNELKRKSRIAAEDNRMRATAFLQENKTKAGIVELPSGLQYKIVKAGQGRKPVDTDTVLCSYRGTLMDGSVFDQTEAGQPAAFKLGSLIAGWKEALKLMPAGSKWQLFVPPQLGYGPQGTPNIGPNELLIFDIELVEVK